MVCVGKDLKAHPVPTPLPWAGTSSTSPGCSELHPKIEDKTNCRGLPASPRYCQTLALPSFDARSSKPRSGGRARRRGGRGPSPHPQAAQPGGQRRRWRCRSGVVEMETGGVSKWFFPSFTALRFQPCTGQADSSSLFSEPPSSSTHWRWSPGSPQDQAPPGHPHQAPGSPPSTNPPLPAKADNKSFAKILFSFSFNPPWELILPTPCCGHDQHRHKCPLDKVAATSLTNICTAVGRCRQLPRHSASLLGGRWSVPARAGEEPAVSVPSAGSGVTRGRCRPSGLSPQSHLQKLHLRSPEAPSPGGAGALLSKDKRGKGM